MQRSKHCLPRQPVNLVNANNHKEWNATMKPQRNPMHIEASNITAPTQFIKTKLETYAYRHLGAGNGVRLLCLQHFTGTLDNWDPTVTDSLALEREVILFESAGIGRSTGDLPETVAGWRRMPLDLPTRSALYKVDLP